MTGRNELAVPLKVLPQLRPVASHLYLCPGPRGEVRQRALEVAELTVEGLPNQLEGLVLAADLQGRELAAPHRLLGEAVAGSLDLPGERWGVLLAGDFYANEAADRMGATGEVAPVWRAFGERFRWVTGVLGNHDLLTGEALLLDGHVAEMDGLRVGGISGIVGKSGRRGRRSPQAYLELVDELVQQRPDVLVMHEAPALPPDLRGREELGVHLARGQGLLVICGHCYWPRPLAQLSREVQVLNVDSRAILLRRAL